MRQLILYQTWLYLPCKSHAPKLCTLSVSCAAASQWSDPFRWPLSKAATL